MKPFKRYLVFQLTKKPKGGFKDFKTSVATLEAAQSAARKNSRNYQIVDIQEGRIVEEKEY